MNVKKIGCVPYYFSRLRLLILSAIDLIAIIARLYVIARSSQLVTRTQRAYNPSSGVLFYLSQLGCQCKFIAILDLIHTYQ